MGSRIQLQTLLEELINSKNVYFQPPPGYMINYPCIIYSRNSENTDFADDIPYNCRIRYQLKIIDRNPDSEIIGKVRSLPTCAFERRYTADNLNHDIYNIYY